MKDFEQKDENRNLRWTEVQRRLLLEGSIFNICEVRRKSSENVEGDFILLDAPDWVTVVPVFEGPEGEDSFLMVEQFRHGSGNVTIEFPAGTVEPGEDPLSAAARELIEETGFRAGKLFPLGSISPNPAFMNNRVHFYLATGLGKEAEQSLDLHEQINYSIYPAEEVRRKMGGGKFDNGVMMLALEYYDRRGRIGSYQV